MKYVCQNCGDTIDGDPEWESWDCVVCGGEVVAEDESEVVPKDDLRELVDRMETAETDDDVTNGVVQYWANELEDLIDE